MTRKFGPRTTAIAIAAALFAASFTLPAFGADSPLTVAKKALKKANAADKRAKSVQTQLAALQRQAGPPGAPGAAGPAGSAGPAGPAGAAGGAGVKGDEGDEGIGTPGTNGQNGTTIEARGRKAGGDVVVSNGAIDTAVPMNGTGSDLTFTHDADEMLEWFLDISIMSPATCTGGQQGIAVRIKDGGTTLVERLIPFQASQPININDNNSFSWETGSTVSRTLSLTVSNGCTDALQNYTVTSARFNALGARPAP